MLSIVPVILTLNNQSSTSNFKTTSGEEYIVPSGKILYVYTIFLTYVSTSLTTQLRLELRDGVNGSVRIPWVASAAVTGNVNPARGDGAAGLIVPIPFTAGNKIELALVAGSGNYSGSLIGVEEDL